MTELNKYKNYWNEWHSKWHHSLTDITIKDICGWTIPKDNGGNKCPIREYFPEPYWGNISNAQLKCVFLNINPGEGGDDQNIRSNSISKLKDIFNSTNKVYSDTVLKLCEDRYYKTTKWMYEKRIFWLQNLFADKTIDVSQTLLGDLIPWHTKSKGDIAKYIHNDKNSDLITKNVILPLAKISNQIDGALQNIVIVRSSLFLDILNSNSAIQSLITNHKEYVVIDRTDKFPKLNSFLSIIEIENTNFLIFSGGASMLLPDLNYDVVPIGQVTQSTKLKQFILDKSF